MRVGEEKGRKGKRREGERREEEGRGRGGKGGLASLHVTLQHLSLIPYEA